MIGEQCFAERAEINAETSVTDSVSVVRGSGPRRTLFSHE